MTMTLINIDRLEGNRSARLSVLSDKTDPVFYVYKNGQFITTMRTNNMILPIDPEELFNIEVRDDADAPAGAHSSFVDLQWDAAPDTDRYIVEEFVASEWVLRTIVPESGQATYFYRTAPLTDDTVATFRITPIGTNGNSGTALTLVLTVITQPDFEDLTITYDDGTNKLTFVAA